MDIRDNELVLNILATSLGLLAIGFVVNYLLRHVGIASERRRMTATYVSLALIVLAMLDAVTGAMLYFSKCFGSGIAHCGQSFVVTVPELGIPLTARYKLDLNFSVYLDPLAVLFLMAAAIIAGLIAVFSWSYLRDNKQNAEIAGYFCMFLLSIFLVFLASNGFWLLLALELVTLAAIPLLLYRFQEGGAPDESRRALEYYLNVSHLSNLLLLGSVLILYVKFNSLQFWLDQIHPLVYASAPETRIAFALAFAALCIRSGVVPFQDWIATVHPQMPTNLHALVSSVMLKIPLYLMVRFFFQYFDRISWAWGVLLVLLAAATAYMSVWSALKSHNLLRTLSYHSTENVAGIALLGMGLALFLKNFPSAVPNLTLEGIAGAALTASLLHALNHSVFKTLLFLNVASIEKHYETFDENAIRMVVTRLPWTGAGFFIGCLAIVGVPGLNGFASKALLFFSFVGAKEALAGAAPVYVVLAGVLLLSLALLGIAYGLTLFAFGLLSKTILFTPIVPPPKREPESIPTRFTVAALSLLCVFIGLVPGALITPLNLVIQSVGFPRSLAQGDWYQFGLVEPEKAGAVTQLNLVIPTAALWLVVLLPLAMATLYSFVRSRSALKVNAPTIGGAPPHMNEPLTKDTMLEPLATAFAIPRLPSLDSFLTLVRLASGSFTARFQPGRTSPYILYLLGFIIAILFVFILFID